MIFGRLFAVPFISTKNICMRFVLLFTCLSVCFFTKAQLSQSSLADILTPNGHIRAGAEGSFSTQGFTMSFDATGAPVFQQSRTTGCDDWDPRFSLGTTGFVQAICIAGGNVYVGGSFTSIGGVSAFNIAMWNGTTWTAMGNSSTYISEVRAIAAMGGFIYVAGDNNSIGAYYLIRWNGTAWSAMPGGGVNGWVRALVVSNNNLYVGGHFTSAGGLPANRLAVFNGTSWAALGEGVSGYVSALAVNGNNVYAGGNFDLAGNNITVNNIAVWNGAQWTAMGSGTDWEVGAVAVNGSDVYIGGAFTTVDGNAIKGIARWNGTAWTNVGNKTGNVFHISVYNNEVYATGYFDSTNASLRRSIARWDGTVWQPIGVPDTTLTVLAFDGANIYAVGRFKSVNNVAAASVAVYNGTQWNAWGNTASDSAERGLSGQVNALAIKGNKLYVGGSFTTVNGIRNFAIWDGNSWSRLGTGDPLDPVYAIGIGKRKIYIGGTFTLLDNIHAKRIAVWNDTAWAQLGQGINDGTVHAILPKGDSVYIGGSFSSPAGGVVYNNVLWNGATYVNLANRNGAVYAMAFYNGQLVVGGNFTGNLATWSGTSWTAIGTAPNGTVNAIGVNGSNLYIGGTFTTVGGVTVNRIARYNGTSWSALGSGFPAGSTIKTLSVVGNTVYAGGTFTTAGGVAAKNLAFWNGSTWSQFGNGTNGIVNTVVAHAPVVYTGGNFSIAGTRLAANLSIYSPCSFPPQVYRMIAGGNYNDPANWLNGLLPPSALPAASEIIINPVTGSVILNTAQTIAPGAIITIKTGKEFIIPANTDINQ